MQGKSASATGNVAPSQVGATIVGASIEALAANWGQRRRTHQKIHLSAASSTLQ